jgi:Fe-S cluster assembly protein SufD
MSAEPRSMKTEAEEGLAANYRAIRDSLAGSKAVAERRDVAFAAFERQGLPHRRVEAWKYTDLPARMKRADPIAPAPSPEAAARLHMALPTFGALDRYRLVIADGYFQEALSDRAALLAEGVEVATLKEFLDVDTPDALTILDAIDPANDDPLVAVNAAFASDGIVILAPADCAPSKPIEIVHLTIDGSGVAWFARSFAKIGHGARLKLLVSHVGSDHVAYQSNSFVGVELADGAEMSVVDLQAEGDGAQHVTTFTANLAASATLRHLAVTGGAALSRLQAFAAIEGEGASLIASGANMLDGAEHGDISWRIDHRVPGATSRVLYKNAAADTAFGAFQGLILVRPDAQKTDGQMMTRTLLLSDETQFAAKPELEIYADDVKCGHGATIGQVDEDALFYMMARGIPRPEAEALLVRAFLTEAVETIGDEAIAAALDDVVSAWLERRAA